ncbi:glycosyltransferase family 2 protein [Desulfovibrio sp.]
MRPAPLLILVVPCYNEEATLPSTQDALANLLKDCKQKGLIQEDSFILYVNDGSHDATWDIIERRHQQDVYCCGISFAGNAGHQNAVWAGMETAYRRGADCIISLDADLQDDISIIPQMLEHYGQGCNIVYGVRNDRSSDTGFKRGTAHLFYCIMGWMGISMIPDHADYRLVARPVLEALQNYHEQDLFLRGLFPTMGFRTAQVGYKRLARTAGETKYPLCKMLAFAWKGITSCSVAPLRLAGIMSLGCMLIALSYSLLSLWKYACGETVPGWTSLIIIVLFLGSVQLLCLSLMGEYLAKIFTEVRHRPRYIIEKEL